MKSWLSPKKTLLAILALNALTGCASASIEPTTAKPVNTFYDYQLHTPQGNDISVTDFANTLSNADVILVGEWHTHPGIHRFQTDLLQALHLHSSNVTLSMEQFTRDNQDIVNQYLAGEIGEQLLIREGNAWPNYESDYRPLVEYAKTNQIDVIAANAPKTTVRCIGRQGIDYLDKLDTEERQWLADTISTQDSPYRKKFLASMHHGNEEQTLKQFAAQVTWDETMADSIVDYLAENPTKQVMHIAGKFHIENGLGTAASIKARNPELNVVLVSPTSKQNPLAENSEDYRLEVLNLPKRFVSHESMMASMKHIGKRNKTLTCK